MPGLSRTELDSHADTCVLGGNVLVTHDYERPVSVSGYDASEQPKMKKTISGVVGYNDPLSGQAIYFVINQAIYVPENPNNLLCPFQMRLNDVKVNDLPKFMSPEPTDETHAITIPLDNDGNVLTIPLSLEGVISYFPTFKPSIAEYESAEAGVNLFHLTYESPDWDPLCPDFANSEENMIKPDGQVVERKWRVPRRICSVHSELEVQPEEFVVALHNNRQIATTQSHVSLAVDRGQEIPLWQRICAVSSTAKPKLEPEVLARRWGIGLEAAKNTLKHTTSRAIRTVLHPSISRRWRTNDRMLRYRRIPVDMFTDTLVTKVKSRRGNMYAQIFGASNGWKRAFPMKKKSEAHEGLSLMFQRDGVPPKLVLDGAKEQISGIFRQKCKDVHVHVRQIEPHTPQSNAAETSIKELKNGVARKMFQSKCPKRLWDDCLELEAFIQSNTWNGRYVNQDEVPETIISGETSDISIFAEHSWYEWVMFRDTTVAFPDSKEVLGRYLGPAIDVGSALTAKILKANGQVVCRSTYRSLTDKELVDENHCKERAEFDASVHERLGDVMTASDLFDGEEEQALPTFELYADNDGEQHQHAEDADVTPEVGDEYVGAQVTLPHGSEYSQGRVVRRTRNEDGTMLGTRNDNPILDTRTYDVEFPDGEVSSYGANVIAENMWAQCDLDGQQQILLDAIIDYRVDEDAIKPADAFVFVNGRQYPKKTTKGVHLCVQWKDGSTSWERLADLKESYPIEVAEFAVSRGLDQQPAFAWWVSAVLRKRNRIIAAVNNRFVKKDFMFGIQVPRNVTEAIALDRENGNTLWQDAIKKEMDAVKIAFRVLDPEEQIPPGYQKISCHMIFTVKMENFRRKARYVADGHKTEVPATLVYASVVGRETVRIALTIAALNDLEVKSADIENAYLNAPNKEKIWVVLGPEWGADAGKKAIIVRALYGQRSAGAAYRSHLAECLRSLGYQSCQADPDLWYKAAIRPEDGFEYYSYLVVYVDDILSINHDALAVLSEIDKYLKMKRGSIGDPDFYLGAKLRKTKLSNGVEAWGFSPSKYVQEAVANVEKYLRKKNLPGLKRKVRGPWPSGYVAELDDSRELNPEEASFYQSQIGILRWCVEIGRIDIITEVSVLSSFNAMPREGHLDAVFHIYAYIKNKHNSRMIFDPTYPNIDSSVFKECDWREFYGDVKEAIPPNAPPPRGKEVVMRLFVDSSHADDKLTRRSRTGYFIYMNMAPIAWLSKKQATIETSVFGAEFVAMKLGVEHVRSLRYKLRMMGVPIDSPAYVYGDNMSVIHNTQRPESMLKKKSNSICYHAVRESVAMNEILTGHIASEHNPADIATKLIPSGMKRDYLVSLVLYDIADG